MVSLLARLTSFFRRPLARPAQMSLALLDDQQQVQNRLPFFDWTPYELRQLLTLFYDGDFTLAEEFYEQVRRDGRIYDGLRRRGNALTRYPQEWKLSKRAPPEVREAVKRMRKCWGRECLTREDLAEICRRHAFFGVVLVQRSYRLVDGVMVPKFTPWTMRNVNWEAYRQIFRVPTRDGPLKEVPLAGDREFIVISSGGVRPWINGALIPLAKLFLLVNQGWDKWAQHNDTQALAIRILKTPFFSREQLESGEAYQYVKLLKSGDTWLNPQGQGETPGYELTLLESKHANAHDAFMHLLEHVWTVIAIVLLGHNLSQEVKGGSLAATKEAMDVTRELSQSDANVIESCFKSVFPEWVVANFSYERRMQWGQPAEAIAPRWKIDAEEKEDEALLAKTSLDRATATKTFVDGATAAKVKIESLGVDWRKQAEECGLCLMPLGPGAKPPEVEYEEPPAPVMPGALPGKKPPLKLMAGKPRGLLMSGRESETEGERRY